MWIAFDLNGTLVDPAALVDGRPELGRRALDDAVLQAMADTITGGFRPFPDYLRAALEREIDGDELERAMERAARLPPFPDAADALRTLGEAGRRVAVVTNSGGDAARATLAAAGLDGYVEAVVGADEVEAYKPDARLYGHAAARLDAPADQICLVAAHAWDVLGAMRAGWRTAWVAHREGRLLATVPEPTIRAASLAEAARALAVR
jgi:2-haloacid dehalogenase